MRFFISFSNLIDSINEKIGQAISWLTLILVLVVCYDVLIRYFLKNSVVAIQEIEWHLFAVIFLISAAYTLKHDRHVRVDVFYAKLSEKKKAWIDFLGSLVFLIPFCFLAIWSSKIFVKLSFNLRETSPDPGGLPARYILKTAIPLGFLLLLLQGISLAIKSLSAITQNPTGKKT